MGSKSPHNDGNDNNGASADTTIDTTNPPKPAAASGLIPGALDGQDENEDEDDHDQNWTDLKSDNLPNGDKKKRKRNKKKKKAPTQQTSPPTIAISTVFKNQPYPKGEIVEYANRDENLQRTTTEEFRHIAAMDDMNDKYLSDYRKAAEVHRQVRQYAQSIAKPGISMTQLAHDIDASVRALVGHQGLEPGDFLHGGLAFPTGLCLNNVGAHWTPNPSGKEVILQQDDVLSIDFGVHINGRIVDSAFTLSFNPTHDPLLAAVRAATNTGLREAGIDARMDHISVAIQEVMESYEVEIAGKSIPVKAVRNLNGHNILRYKIHGDKQVPFYKSKSTQRMEEGDVFAIETFGSTGTGYLRDQVGVYGYGRDENVGTNGLRHASAKALLKTIDEHFGTIVFPRRDLARLGVESYLLGMKALVDRGIVEQYAPLVDVPGSYVAQFEHTVLLRPNCKEVISRGDDY